MGELSTRLWTPTEELRVLAGGGDITARVMRKKNVLFLNTSLQCYFSPGLFWAVFRWMLKEELASCFSRIYQPLKSQFNSKTPSQNANPANFPLIIIPLAAGWCLVELIALAVFPAKQVAILDSFWQHLWECASRLDRDDSASSLPRMWPWLGDGPSALALFSHWPFGPTSDCVCVCVCVIVCVFGREHPLMCSQIVKGPGWQSGQEGGDNDSKLCNT